MDMIGINVCQISWSICAVTAMGGIGYISSYIFIFSLTAYVLYLYCIVRYILYMYVFTKNPHTHTRSVQYLYM